MKRFAWILLCLFLSLLSGCRSAAGDAIPTTAEPEEVLPGPVIVLDPGHGGPDLGCSGNSGTEEAQLNLAVAQALRQALELQGATVVMTRTGSEVTYQDGAGKTKKQQEMAARMETIRSASCDLAVSIHMNAYPSPDVRGAQVFYHSDHPQSASLAEALQQRLNAMPEQIKKRESARGDYFILKTDLCPVVLVECGFLSNPEEEALLMKPAYQARLAAVLCHGLLDFYEDHLS